REGRRAAGGARRRAAHHRARRASTARITARSPSAQAARRRTRGGADPAHLSRAAARGPRVIRRVAGYALAALVLAAVTLASVVTALLEPRADEGADVLFEVRHGDSLRAIATRLEQRELVRDASATTWWARLHGKAEELHVGEYWISPAMSPAEIIDRI